MMSATGTLESGKTGFSLSGLYYSWQIASTGSMMTSGERYVKDALVVAVLVGIVAASGGLAAVAVKLFV